MSYKKWIIADFDKAFAKKIAEEKLSLEKQDKIVITGGDTSGASGNTNLIKIESI